MPENPDHCFAYVGCYGSDGAPTIHLFELDLRHGSMQLVQENSDVAQASWLALHPGGRFLYAVSERGNLETNEHGAAAAFRRDPRTGRIVYLNQQSVGDAGPCYIAIHPSGRLAALANYMGGSLTILTVLDDGTLGTIRDRRVYSGSSTHARRQASPHAHSAVFSPDGRHLFVQDLGTDQLHQYRIHQDGTLLANDPPAVRVEPGSGPRHLIFHPSRPFAYLTHELSNTVSAYRYDADSGKLAEVRTLSMLPPGFTGHSQAADIHITPDGAYLYASNRGHDSLMAWRVDPDSGQLDSIGDIACGGATPRGFAIDPSGRWLLVAHQESHSLLSMRIDSSTGGLTPCAYVNLRQPVCVLMTFSS